MFLGGFRWWNGRGMAGDEGWVLGEFGEANGKRVEAGNRFGSVEKEEEALLEVSGWEWVVAAEGRLGNWGLSPGHQDEGSDHSLRPLSLLEVEETEKKRDESFQVEEKEWKWLSELGSILGSL